MRLHPRKGAPSCRDSSVGGPLLWPAEEQWPVCADAECPGGAGTPLVPIVQVHQAHALPQVHWRSAAVDAVLPTPPPPPDALEDYVPDACVVHPEQVTEYPSWDLPEDVHSALSPRFDQLEDETGWMYQYHLADAPGIKLGGYPGWTQEPVWPDCASCGRRMDHLLTVASWEYDGESWRTWLPVEDRAVVDGEDTSRSGQGLAAQDAAGLMLGDAGGVYIFECRSCPDRPIEHRFDCS